MTTIETKDVHAYIDDLQKRVDSLTAENQQLATKLRMYDLGLMWFRQYYVFNAEKE
jgi:hypothetical protein